MCFFFGFGIQSNFWWVCLCVCEWFCFLFFFVFHHLVQFININKLEDSISKMLFQIFKGFFLYCCCCLLENDLKFFLWREREKQIVYLLYDKGVCGMWSKEGNFYNYNSKYADKYLLFDHKLYSIFIII